MMRPPSDDSPGLGSEPARSNERRVQTTGVACGKQGRFRSARRTPRIGFAEQTGFNLSELLIAVAIAGIIAGLAYPTYTDQVAKARRAEIQMELLSLAQWMERTYTETGCYNPGTDRDCSAGIPEAPDISRAGDRFDYYRIAFSGDVAASRFLIQATPAKDSAQADDGILRIDHLGRRFWDENNDGDITDPNEDNWVRD